MHCNSPFLLNFMWRQVFVAAGLGVAVSGGCRVASSGDDAPTEEVGQSDALSGQGSPRGGSQRMPVGDPRVSLLNAPCGNAPDVEVFLSKARSLGLANQIIKLPAAEWRVTSGGKSMSICAFLAAEKLDLAFFQVFSGDCLECLASIKSDAQILANALPQGITLSIRMVAVQSAAANGESADATLPLIQALDPKNSLLTTLAAKIPAPTAPWFVVHKSGFGFFSNTSGSARDATRADFLSLVKALQP